ncbi:MAG TPA: hypothetical protein VFL27_14085 [Candidatus Dormibacteraeota bacterium]|nr:hypothetical protein [Candidatus Dormibacteraeota bacterium]
MAIRWVVVWIIGAVMLVSAFLILYLSPALFVGSKGAGGPLLPPQAAPSLLIAGVSCLVFGTVGMWSRVRSAANMPQGDGTRVSDIGATLGLVVAALALLGVATVFVAPPLAQIGSGPDPCAQAPGPSCFSAHSDYYQPMGSGSDAWSTPASRISQAVGPLFLYSWPLAVAGALISIAALAAGTAHRRTAISGLILGSAVAVGQGLIELGFMLGGGGD